MIEYRAGAVWWGLIDFNDGHGERKKYFVLLSDCDQFGTQALAAITTSNGNRYAGATSGSPCSPTGRCYRIDGMQEKCFSVNTWVQFDNSNLISRARLDALEANGKARFIQVLSEERVRSVLNCAKKSRDIAIRDLSRIDVALKARAPAKKTPPQAKVPSASPPSLVAAEVLALRDQVKSLCRGCRTEFAELITISDCDLAATLIGVKAPADTFIMDANTALELLADKRKACIHCATSAFKD